MKKFLIVIFILSVLLLTSCGPKAENEYRKQTKIEGTLEITCPNCGENVKFK